MIQYELMIINGDSQTSTKNFLYPSAVEEEINKLLDIDENYKIIFECLFKIKDMFCPDDYIEYRDENIFIRITRE